MVQRLVKIPKHGGPDGTGLPRPVFDHLLVMFEDVTINDIEIKGAIELCLSASTRAQWLDYREELVKRLNQ
jgi:hypothetical protein